MANEERTIPLQDEAWTITLDKSKLGDLVLDTLADLGDVKIGTAAKGLFKAAKKTESLPDKAFELFVGGLKLATKRLLQAHAQEQLNNAKGLISELNLFEGRTKDRLAEEEVVISRANFTFPLGWGFLRTYASVLKDFLDVLAVPFSEKTTILAELPEYFWNGLTELFDQEPERYAPLLQYLDNNPFTEGRAAFTARKERRAVFSRHYARQVLGSDTITLRDIYVPPRYGVHFEHMGKETKRDRDGFTRYDASADLHSFINDYWLLGKSKLGARAETSPLLLLLGQPGQGKSSFCLRTLSDQVNRMPFTDELHFCRLNAIANPATFFHQPLRTLDQKLNNGEPIMRGLIILDGLDEMYMNRGLTDAQVSDFFKVLWSTLPDRPDLRVIVTSRFNFVTIDDLSFTKMLVLKIHDFQLEGQLEMLFNLRSAGAGCKLTKERLNYIHEQRGRFKEVYELLGQPILFQLINRIDIDFDREPNRGEIYNQLFDELVHRTWDGGQLEKLRIDEDMFRTFMRRLALKVYHSHQEYITYEDLAAWDDPSADFLRQTSRAEYERLEDTFKDVLILFYFVQLSAEAVDGERHAIEFYHKTLQEYLAMECIWEAFKTGLKPIEKAPASSDGFYRKLASIWHHCAPTVLEPNNAELLKNIIANDKDFTSGGLFTESLIKMLPWMLERQFTYGPAIQVNDRLAVLQSASVARTYWLIIKHTATSKRILSSPLNQDLITLLTIYQDQFSGRINLNTEDLSGVKARGMDLRGANLENARLMSGEWQGAVFIGANLNGAKLSESDFSGADFSGADLRGTEIYDCNLSGVNLNHAIVDDEHWLQCLESKEILGFKTISHYGHEPIEGEPCAVRLC
jgi:hypothetical protein